MEENQGWISLHRKLLEWEWYTDINTTHLFIYCLLKASHKEKKWRGVDIQRGTFLTSLDSMSKETGLSVMQIRTSLAKLKLTNEITSKPSNKNRLITVTNYNTYQDDNKQDNRRVTSKQQTNNKQVTTTNNDNNDNNDNKRIITVDSKESFLEKEFEEFWKRYPTCERNKGVKHKAFAKFKIARKSISFETIMYGLSGYAQHLEKTQQKNADAFRWLQDKRWEEEYEREKTREEKLAEIQRNVSMGREKCKLITS